MWEAIWLNLLSPVMWLLLPMIPNWLSRRLFPDSMVAAAARIADAPERQKPLRIDLTYGVPQLTLKFEFESRPPFQRVAVQEIAFSVGSILRFPYLPWTDGSGVLRCVVTTLTSEQYDHLVRQKPEHLNIDGVAKLSFGRRIITKRFDLAPRFCVEA